jgi:hypothetical protein
MSNNLFAANKLIINHHWILSVRYWIFINDQGSGFGSLLRPSSIVARQSSIAVIDPAVGGTPSSKWQSAEIDECQSTK